MRQATQAEPQAESPATSATSLGAAGSAATSAGRAIGTMTAGAANTAGVAAKGAAKATGRSTKRTGEVLIGTDIRSLDEFTDAVTRVVVGLHRENTDLKERVARLEAVVAELKGC